MSQIATKKVWPQFTSEMILAVTKVLESGKVNQWTGSYVTDFEKAWSNFFNVKYSVAVSNGTTALDACLYAINLNPDDEVIVTCRSFIASATTINFNNGIPVFVDVNSSGNMSLENIKKATTPKTKAVILVHIGGLPCDCNEISLWCKENNIYLIEDCAQSTGATISNKYVGTFGDISAWSFCQDKIITTGGEGGMVTTNNNVLYKRAWSYKDHGKNYDKIFNVVNDGNFKYVHDEFGTNCRMTSMQAVIGLEALKILPTWLEIRKKNADMLTQCLSQYDFIELEKVPNNVTHAYYKYYFYVKHDILQKYIITEFRKHGIFATAGSCCEMYKEKCYETYKIQHCPIAENMFKRSVLMQVDPTYTTEIMQQIINIMHNILKNIKLLYIFGSGGHSKVVTDTAIDNGYIVLGYIDSERSDKTYKYRDISIIDEFCYIPYCKYIIAYGNNNKRQYIADIYNYLQYATLIHSTAYVASTANINHGSIIMPRAVVNSEASIGKHCIINSSSIVEHDCIIGDYSHVAPNAVMCGNTTLKNNVLLGANSCVINNTITIGTSSIVGANSTVLGNVENNTVVYGIIKK